MVCSSMISGTAMARDRRDGRQVSSIGSGPRFQLADVITAMATIVPKKIWASSACRMAESSAERVADGLRSKRAVQRLPTARAIQPNWTCKSNRQADHKNHGHAADNAMPELEGRIDGGRGVVGDGPLQAGDNGAGDDRDQREEGDENGVTM